MQRSTEILSATSDEMVSPVVIVEPLQEADITSYVSIVSKRIVSDDPQEEERDVNGLVKVYRQRLNQPDRWTILVAKSENGIVGGLEGEILTSNESVSGRVNWVRVDDGFQRGKVATTLYREYQKILLEKEIPIMSAYVDSTNVQSQAFHLSVGFQKMERTANGHMYRKAVSS